MIRCDARILLVMKLNCKDNLSYVLYFRWKASFHLYKRSIFDIKLQHQAQENVYCLISFSWRGIWSIFFSFIFWARCQNKTLLWHTLYNAHISTPPHIHIQFLFFTYSTYKCLFHKISFYLYPFFYGHLFILYSFFLQHHTNIVLKTNKIKKKQYEINIDSLKAQNIHTHSIHPLFVLTKS